MILSKGIRIYNKSIVPIPCSNSRLISELLYCISYSSSDCCNISVGDLASYPKAINIVNRASLPCMCSQDIHVRGCTTSDD